MAGVSRSCTIAAAYIILVTGIDATGALEKLRAARPIAGPNGGFVQQLHNFAASDEVQVRAVRRAGSGGMRVQPT